MEENNNKNTQQNIQGNTGGAIPGQQNSQRGAGFVVGNDTTTNNTGTGGVVSLKGGLTQKEIEEQKRIEELKSKAVKLERKLTPKEKELVKMYKKAVKPIVPVGKVKDTEDKRQTNSKRQDTRDKQIPRDKIQETNKFQETRYNQKENNSIGNIAVDPQKQTKLAENLINPEEDAVNKNNKNIPKSETAPKPKRRMVISPGGQISYVDAFEDRIIDEEKKTTEKRRMAEERTNGTTKKPENNIVDLKREIDKKNTSSINSNIGIGLLANADTDNVINQEEDDDWEDKKVDLKNLTPENRLEIQATPSLASVNFNMDDDLNKEMVAWFDEYNKLPVNIKLGLGSREVKNLIKQLANKMGLVIPGNNKISEGNLGEISRIIRDVYVKLIKGTEIENRLSTVLKIKKENIKSVLEDIAKIVSLVKEVGTQKSEEYFDKLSIREALEKYPKIKDQEITGGMITDKNTGEYLSPTVQNWIDDYINQMGSDQHTSLERGKYLADSKNVKNLEEEDKKVVEKLIESYDEGKALIIDKEEGDVLWNLHQDESQLGINSDKNKRVINKFKIEEAQTVDHEIVADEKSGEAVVKKDLENNKAGSIIRSEDSVDNKKGFNKNEQQTTNLTAETKKPVVNENDEERLLDLSSEIPAKK